MKSKRVPQICETTGVSADYWNEYAGIPIWSSLDFSPETNRISLGNSPIRRYTERFSIDVYVDVITPINQQRVERLDQIANEVNSLATPEAFSIDALKDFVCEAHELVYGRSVVLKPKNRE